MEVVQQYLVKKREVEGQRAAHRVQHFILRKAGRFTAKVVQLRA